MRFIFERLKIVVDENAAATVAALFTEQFMQICESKEYRYNIIMNLYHAFSNCNYLSLQTVAKNKTNFKSTI